MYICLKALQNLQLPCTVGRAQDNAKRNRFKDITPCMYLNYLFPNCNNNNNPNNINANNDYN